MSRVGDKEILLNDATAVLNGDELTILPPAGGGIEKLNL